MLAKEEIARMVEAVMQKMARDGVIAPALEQGARAAQRAASEGAVPIDPTGVYPTVTEAARAARVAFAQLQALPLLKRREIVGAMRVAARAHERPLAEHAVRETGLGRVDDKVLKNRFAAEKTPGVEDILTLSWSGDDGLTVVERAPWGVIGSITPTTNPTSTIINNAISLVSAGNAAVFNFHPMAKGCCAATVELLNRAIEGAGGPASLLTCVAEPTIETAQALMQHPGIDALLVTGGGPVVTLAMTCGKKVWAAGPGNPPTVVDETADLAKAAKAIVDGASFDNTVLCTAEKECFVVAPVADQLKQLMVEHGAYEVRWSEIDRLVRLLYPSGDTTGKGLDRRYIGKDAALILKAAGLTPAPNTRLVICEVPPDHPFVTNEMLLPVLPVVRVPDVDTAIDRAIRAEKGHRHTASIHSNDIRNLSRMAREAGCAIFVKNGPHYAGLGIGGEGFTSLSIAGTTGDGITSARTFTRERRCVMVGHLRII
ncbi:MAG TPA: aldehyde dehydrogenase family protein [Symbiobacteriaceae bacterium]|nr:aldehyde dehydrogenase family protein [Symbiobacteriaceae bacterium]